MKQTNKLKMIAAMAVSVTVALFSASCSSDEFFGFEKNEKPLIDINPSYKDLLYRIESTPFYIAKNKEYQDYLNSYECLYNEINNIIITKTYEKNRVDSLMELHIVCNNNLIKMYPEFKTLPELERKFLAYYSKGLIDTKGNPTKKYLPKRTKGNAPENAAIGALGLLLGVIYEMGMYCYDGVWMEVFPGDGAIAAAIVRNLTCNVEYGGVGYNDSSILMTDPQAKPNEMNIVIWYVSSYPLNYIFHVHPVTDISTYTYLDDEDENTRSIGSSVGHCSDFRVYDWSCHYHTFSARGTYAYY